MKDNHRQSLGHSGEALAATFLEEGGYSILGRNVRTPYGEIDLIASQGEMLVFIEVKTRASKSLGPPEISITPSKQNHMRSAAESYMQQHPEIVYDYRIDVIAIQMRGTENPPQIDHFENVIT